MSFLDPASSLSDFIKYAVAIIVFISVILAVLYSLWGGFLLITSGGNEEKVKPAVNHIRHAALGLIVLVIIIFVTPQVLGAFGLPYGTSLDPTTIFQTIREISGRLFDGTNTGTTPNGSDTLDSLPSDFSDL